MSVQLKCLFLHINSYILLLSLKTFKYFVTTELMVIIKLLKKETNTF